MKRRLLFLMAVSISIYLAGCDTNGSDGQDGDQNSATAVNEQIGKILYENDDQTMALAASEKKLPANFDDLALERKAVPLYQYLVKKAENQSEYEDAWDLYELEDQAPNMDFDKENAFFIGMYESGEGAGNCPAMIKDIKWDAATKTMKVFINEIVSPHDGCDDIATPRTHVIKIDKEISRAVENVTMVEEYNNDHIETDVPVGN